MVALEVGLVPVRRTNIKVRVRDDGIGCSIRFASLLAIPLSMLPTDCGWAEPLPEADLEFGQLRQALVDREFHVLLQPPPQQGAYGLLEPSSRTIWIHPIVFDLGIPLPVLVHEGVHAAQLCAGNGVIATLNLDVEPPNITRPLFLRYHTYRRQIESEAYAVQVQPDAYERVMTLLEQHC